MLSKRTVVLTLVVALALSSLGIVSANAASTVTGRSAQAQEAAPGWLGVLVRDADDGVLIEEVTADSPAEDAGLKAGDIILAVDDTAMESVAQLVETIQSYAAGDTVTLTVLTDGDETSVEVTLAERPASAVSPRPDVELMPGLQGRMNMWGLDLALTSDGLLVQSIDPDSPLAESGLQEDDLITAIDGELVSDMLPRAMLRLMRGDETVTLTVLRDGEAVEVELNIAELIGSLPSIPDSMTAVARPTQLGIRYRTLTPEIAEDEGLSVEQGALVTEVYDGTPAAEAGLQAGDAITAVNGDVVDEQRTLGERLYAYDEGDVVTLTVLRGGEELSVEVTLGSRGRFFPFGELMPGDDVMPYGFYHHMQPGQGQGRGRGRGGMMPYRFFGQPGSDTMPYGRFEFHMQPGRGMRGFLGENFFENHPFMKDFLDNLPGGSFEFRFGPQNTVPDTGESSTTTDNGLNA